MWLNVTKQGVCFASKRMTVSPRAMPSLKYGMTYVLYSLLLIDQGKRQHTAPTPGPPCAPRKVQGNFQAPGFGETQPWVLCSSGTGASREKMSLHSWLINPLKSCKTRTFRKCVAQGIKLDYHLYNHPTLLPDVLIITSWRNSRR